MISPKERRSLIRMTPKERVQAFEEAGVSVARFRVARIVLSLGFLAFAALLLFGRWGQMSDTLYSVLSIIAVIVMITGIVLNARINRMLIYKRREEER